ncbi:MAG: tRNA (adenosine(37)-N6)-threonylcarbamoyltransferase complex dimerization subunit type 1 TsaB [Dehalococcoidia bacterium]|nr:tRNA (adenosine(37)-N6)-threonylcarbamoyltransferase complex dimerization subunit type 1 TsaB [Dehalococcoidia bacterium]
MELSIDTSTRYASVALTNEGALLAETSWHSQQNHTVELAPAVQRLLEQVHAAPADVKAVFVALGPGGFSALRVGLGFAKGLAEGLGVPIVGVGTLEVEAFPHATTGLPVYAVSDAGRAQLAWTSFTLSGDQWSKTQDESIGTPQQLAESVQAPAVLCGEGLAAHAQALRLLLPAGVLIVDTPPPTRRAATLARLGWRRLARGERDDTTALQPLYLRRPTITLPGGRKE